MDTRFLCISSGMMLVVPTGIPDGFLQRNDVFSRERRHPHGISTGSLQQLP